MFSQQERDRAVESCFSTGMTTQEVVEYLGYPTRRCLECWLHEDPRYADTVAKPIILPLQPGESRASVPCRHAAETGGGAIGCQRGGGEPLDGLVP